MKTVLIDCNKNLIFVFIIWFRSQNRIVFFKPIACCQQTSIQFTVCMKSICVLNAFSECYSIQNAFHTFWDNSNTQTKSTNYTIARKKLFWLMA